METCSNPPNCAAPNGCKRLHHQKQNLPLQNKATDTQPTSNPVGCPTQDTSMHALCRLPTPERKYVLLPCLLRTRSLNMCAIIRVHIFQHSPSHMPFLTNNG